MTDRGRKVWFCSSLGAGSWTVRVAESVGLDGGWGGCRGKASRHEAGEAGRGQTVQDV